MLADDLGTFIVVLDQRKALWASSIPNISFLYRISEDTFRDAIARVDKILYSWNSWFDDYPYQIDSQVILYRSILERAHNEYRILFQQQEQLLSNGTFCRSIAAAFGRMTTAQNLELLESDYVLCAPAWELHELANDNEILQKSMLQPIDWDDTRIHNLGELPGNALTRLPGAMHEAGSMITTLDIHLPALEDCSPLTSTMSNLQSVTASIQRLKSFSFSMRSLKYQESRPTILPHQAVELALFLNALLDTDSLETISISFETLWSLDDPPEFSLGSLISSRRWRKLKSFSGAGIPLHVAALAFFVKNLPNCVEKIDLDYPYLLTGSWAEVLDVLRECAVHVTLHDPCGAECADMSWEERSAILSSLARGSRYSPAELYLMKLTDRNPVERWCVEMRQAYGA